MTEKTIYHKPKDLCESGALPYGYRKVLKLIESGEIKAINVGTKDRRIWRITQSELDRITNSLNQ
jgi:hypothetical protein